MRIHGNATLLGLDQRLVFPFGISALLTPTPDAHDFYNSPIFDSDPITGLGGWGDRSDDFQITTGAFASNFVPAYPAPHRIRRNYTSVSSGGGFGDGTPPITRPLSSFFSLESIKPMVDGFPGDFVGFQKLFEGGDGSHGAIHQILGGCVTSPVFVLFWRTKSLTSVDSDMFGMCPLSAGRKCVRGPKWTPNGSFRFVSFFPWGSSS